MTGFFNDFPESHGLFLKFFKGGELMILFGLCFMFWKFCSFRRFRRELLGDFWMLGVEEAALCFALKWHHGFFKVCKAVSCAVLFGERGRELRVDFPRS